MSAIIKVSFNILSKTYEAAGDGGKVGKFLYYHENDSSETEIEEETPVPPISQLTNGRGHDEETIAADSIEDAIEKIRIAKTRPGNGFYWDWREDENGKPLKKPIWRYTEVVAIQIVRAEPVAFTTL